MKLVILAFSMSLYYQYSDIRSGIVKFVIARQLMNIIIRVGPFWNFTFVHIGEGYCANIKHCKT